MVVSHPGFDGVSNPSLMVITDDGKQLALPDTIANLKVTIFNWQDIERLPLMTEAAVLIDVDLHDISKIKLIKDRLPHRPGNQCRIIAVDHRSRRAQMQANSLGASALLGRPLDINELKARLQQHFATPTTEPDLHTNAGDHEPGTASVISAAVALNGIFRAITHSKKLELASVRQASDQVIDAIAEVGFAPWVQTVRNHHQGTFQHCLLVTGVLTIFGHKTGMRRSDVLTLTVAGLLHDIGKAQIPVGILDKPGKLTNEEFATVQRHSAIGHDYLCKEPIVSSEILDAVRHHHEYLDGSGYPDGLQGQQINDLCRILTVCDTYGALIEQRAYKAATPPVEALEIVATMAKAGKLEYSLVQALRHCVAS